MPHDPSFSVIVPAFNAEATLGACLASLVAQTAVGAPYEVLVVSDGSTDGTATVAQRFAGVRLLTIPHQGAAGARNHGAAAALGPLLLFTDADCEPAPDWAARMTEPFVDGTVAGVKGLFATHQRGWLARLVQAEYEEKEATMLGRAEVAFADTAAAAYRAGVFRAAGGFRTDLQAVEDTELAFRLAEAGQRIVVAAGATVFHRHPEDLLTYARRKFRYGLWGAWAYLAFPRRLADDSRTPWSMRVQMVLAPCLALAALALPLWAGARGLLAAGLLAFVATVLPFSLRRMARDPVVALAAPAVFFVRALAVSSGLALGLVRLAAGASPPLAQRTPPAPLVPGQVPDAVRGPAGAAGASRRTR